MPSYQCLYKSMVFWLKSILRYRNGGYLWCNSCYIYYIALFCNFFFLLMCRTYILMLADLPRQRLDCAPAPPPHPSLGLTRFLPPHPPARSCLLLVSSTLSGSGPCPLSFRSFPCLPHPPLRSFLPSSHLLDRPWLLLAILHPGPWHAFTALPLHPPRSFLPSRLLNRPWPSPWPLASFRNPSSSGTHWLCTLLLNC